MLAVAAGESGASPELSRNGVLACAPTSVGCRTPVQSEDLPTVHPAVRSGCPDVRASWNGPVDATPCALVSCPLPSARPRAERGRAPRDHRASRSGLSPGDRGARRTRCRAAAHPDRADRRPPRRRPRPGRRRRTARPVRARRRERAAGAGHGGRGRPDLGGPRLFAAGRPAADRLHPRRGGFPGRHVLHRVRGHRPPRGPDRRPHGGVRPSARGPPRRADRHRRRRPLRLLRAAHPAQPLPAAAPAHPQGRRDAPALPAAGGRRPRRGRHRAVRRRSGRPVRPDEPPGLPAVLPHAVQLRHPAPQMSSCYLLDSPRTSWTRSTSATTRSPGSPSTPAASAWPTPASAAAVR